MVDDLNNALHNVGGGLGRAYKFTSAYHVEQELWTPFTI